MPMDAMRIAHIGHRLAERWPRGLWDAHKGVAVGLSTGTGRGCAQAPRLRKKKRVRIMSDEEV